MQLAQLLRAGIRVPLLSSRLPHEQPVQRPGRREAVRVGATVPTQVVCRTGCPLTHSICCPGVIALRQAEQVAAYLAVIVMTTIYILPPQLSTPKIKFDKCGGRM